MSPEEMTDAELLDALKDDLAAVHDRADKLNRTVKRTRFWTWVTGISVGLDLLLSVVLGITVVRAQDTADTIVRDRKRSAYNFCLQENRDRKRQRDIWEFIFDLTPDSERPPMTDVEKQRLAKFKEYLDTAYTPLDCGEQPN